MKHLIRFTLSLALILNSSFAFALDEAATQWRVDKVTYELATIEDAIAELKFINDQEIAGKGLSKQIMEKLINRIQAGMLLMHDLLLDKKIGADKKAEYIKGLNVELSTAIQKIGRFQKEDKKEDVRLADYANQPEIKRLNGELATLAKNSPEAKAKQREIMAKLDELEAAGAPTRQDELNIALRILDKLKNGTTDVGSEIIMDFKALFTVRMTNEGKMVWAAMDRIRHDVTTQNALREIGEMSETTLAELNEKDEYLSKMQNFWTTQMIQTGQLRAERLDAQRAAWKGYLGFAFVGLFMPMFDVVGFLDGGISENSHFASGVTYFVAWSVLASLKYGSYSAKTVGMIKAVRDMLKDPRNVNMSKMPEMQKRSLWEKILRRNALKNCEVSLKKGGEQAAAEIKAEAAPKK